MEPQAGPIRGIEWGRMEVELGGRVLVFKDCRLWPGGADAWDWTITDTHHTPGTQPADVEELLARGAEVLVLSRGIQLALGTDPRTLALLGRRGIPFHVAETRRAVALFNRLSAEGRRAGGLFHSTC